MADELTSNQTALEPSGDTGQAQTSAPETPQPQAPDSGTTQQTSTKVNLYELPEFRQYQSQRDREFSQMQAQLNQLSQSQHEQTMAGMDDLEKANYLLRLKDQEVSGYRQTLQQQQIANQRAADIARLSKESGAPHHLFESAETYDDAVAIALGYTRQNSQTTQTARQERTEANRVDLGGGNASTPQERRDREMTEALKRGDAMSFYKQLLEG